jgi:hypothetical protein
MTPVVVQPLRVLTWSQTQSRAGEWSTMTAAVGHSSTRSATHAAADQEVPSVARAATWALGSCLALALALFAAASFAGTPLDVVRADGRTVVVSASNVAVSVMLAVGLGTVLLAAVGRRSRRAWLAVAAAGPVVALASLAAPLTSEAAPVTTVLLVAMHLVCGLAWATVLVALLRRG